MFSTPKRASLKKNKRFEFEEYRHILHFKLIKKGIQKQSRARRGLQANTKRSSIFYLGQEYI